MTKNLTDAWIDDVAGKCPVCGHLTSYEKGVEVCYYCGWCEEKEENDSEPDI